MREMDFTEKNLRNRWLGVNSIWSAIQGETKGYVKRRLEHALQEEVRGYLGCKRYERSRERCGYRNGCYTRELLTTYGWIADLQVPRLRKGGYESQVLVKYHRRQRAVDQVLLEVFLLGHSTRKTRRILGHVFGGSISAQGISNVVRKLNGEVEAFHRRTLVDTYEVLYLDGLWVTVRKPVKMKKVVLVALGVREDGSKELLSFQVVPRESEACWWGFLSDLKERGLSRPGLVISDGAPGLLKALYALYPRSAHQLCTFHKAMDLGMHLSEKRHRRQIIADALHIFEADTETVARKRLRQFEQTWVDKEPKAVRIFLGNIDACFVYFRYPPPLWRSLKTTNPIERTIEEIRRRIIPMRSFNNVKSVERIIYGIIAYVINQ